MRQMQLNRLDEDVLLALKGGESTIRVIWHRLEDHQPRPSTDDIKRALARLATNGLVARRSRLVPGTEGSIVAWRRA